MSKKIKRVLIANRGEIAIRVIRTLKEMGIVSVAVYSDEDAGSPHVYHADYAYRIGESPSSKSYLNIKNIIKVAKKAKVDAIHPGYGFLSENSDFVDACTKNKIIFIGPSKKSMEMMGDKITARQIMKKAKVPIIPGTFKGVTSKEAKVVAKKIGYPILLKATAGGGGKGMRKVNSERELEEAFAMAASEAKKAFSNATLYVEKFIEKPRHIEVQVLADNAGNVSHVYNRECSVQRRHQKIIEEAPAPNLSQKTANKMYLIACKAAKAVKYRNAGTVEFIVDKNENFYFLEMNARLQVEHPVTEMITGLDLVKEQINIASGGKLFGGNKLPQANGSSIECRIYAEDPSHNYAPSPGKITCLNEPSGHFVRVDSGVSQNSNVSLYYDPLLAKLTTWSRHRKDCIEKSKRALSEYMISGIKTNIEFLYWVLDREEFRKGKIATNFLDENKYKSHKLSKDELNAALITMALKNDNNNDDGRLDKDRRLNSWKTAFRTEDIQ